MKRYFLTLHVIVKKENAVNHLFSLADSIFLFIGRHHFFHANYFINSMYDTNNKKTNKSRKKNCSYNSRLLKNGK